MEDKDIRVHEWNCRDLKERGYHRWFSKTRSLNHHRLSERQFDVAWHMSLSQAVLLTRLKEIREHLFEQQYGPETQFEFRLFLDNEFAEIPPEINELCQMKETWELESKQKEQKKAQQQPIDLEDSGFFEGETEEKSANQQEILQSLAAMKEELVRLKESISQTKQQSPSAQDASIPVSTNTASQTANQGAPVQSSNNLPSKKKNTKLSAEEKKMMRIARDVTADFHERLRCGQNMFVSLMREKYPGMSDDQIELAWTVEKDLRVQLKKRRKTGGSVSECRARNFKVVRSFKVVDAQEEESDAEEAAQDSDSVPEQNFNAFQ